MTNDSAEYQGRTLNLLVKKVPLGLRMRAKNAADEAKQTLGAWISDTMREKLERPHGLPVEATRLNQEIEAVATGAAALTRLVLSRCLT